MAARRENEKWVDANERAAQIVVNPDGTVVGSGGGPSTIADGADVNAGSTTDAAVSTNSNGTISAKLRGLIVLISAMSAKLPAVLGQQTSANSMSVVLASDQPFGGQVSTASLTTLASSAASAQLLAANVARRGLILVNTDVNTVRVKYGATASATSFSVAIPQDGYWEMPQPIYTGRVDAIWDADGSGSLFATEL